MTDDALRCEACGTEYEVVESPEGDPGAELVCVQMVRSPEELQVVASLLDAEGIPVALHNEVGFALHGLADGPFSWDPVHDAVRVMVPKTNEQAALDLLAAKLPAGTAERAEAAGEAAEPPAS